MGQISHGQRQNSRNYLHIACETILSLTEYLSQSCEHTAKKIAHMVPWSTATQNGYLKDPQENPTWMIHQSQSITQFVHSNVVCL